MRGEYRVFEPCAALTPLREVVADLVDEYKAAEHENYLDYGNGS
jgi:hypothetical protein